MAQRLNRDRAAQGLPALRYDPRLADAARSHATDMRDNRYFEHESPRFGNLESRLDRAGYLHLGARENLAEALDVERGQDALLKSPHHYENIMASDVTHIGVGIVQGGVKDPKNLTMTQIFAAPIEQPSPAALEKDVAAAIARARQQQGLPALARSQKLDAWSNEQVGRLTGPPDESMLGPIRDAIAAHLNEEATPGGAQITVSVGAQMVMDSSQFQVTSALLDPKARHFGLCTRTITGEKGRPALVVLLLVGL